MIIEMNETLSWALSKFSSPESYEQIVNDFAVKNDVERIQFAIEFLLKNLKPLKIQHQQKNNAKTKEKIKEAMTLIDSKAPEKKILENYTCAIAYAQPKSEELALAYANRSAALFNAKYFEDSLRDIHRALQNSYPDKLKAQLFVRRAKCLLAINPSMRPEVADAIANGHYYLGFANEANKRQVRKKLDVFGSKNIPSFGPAVEKWDDRQFLPKTPGGNTKILRACDGVAIKFSVNFGRHIVATRNIDAGETIMVHKAFVSTLLPEHFYSYCWNCSRRAWTGVPCLHCVNVIFCSETCRDKAWLDYHDLECAVISALSAEAINSVDVMTLRITIKAIKEAKTVKNLQTKIGYIDSIGDPITRAFTEGVFNDTKYASICTLMRKPEEPHILFQHALRAACLLYYLAACTEIFEKKIYDFKILLDNKLALFVGGLILRNFEISISNGTEIFSNDDKGNFIRKCGQLISFQSLFNHSCDPNAYQYTSGDMNAIIALEMIKEGQQVLISYGPGYTQLTVDQRRQRLLKTHKFFCECYACDNNWFPGIRIKSFAELQISASVKEILNNIKDNNYSYRFPLTLNIIKDKSVDNIQRTFSSLFEVINAYGEYLDVPCQELQILKMSLTKIYNEISR